MTVDQPVNEYLSCDDARALRRPILAINVAISAGVAVLVASTILGQAASERATNLLALDIAVGVANCVLVPVLLRWPVVGALAVSLLAALSPAATATAGALVVAQRRRFGMAVAVGMVGIAAHVVQGLWRPVTGSAGRAQNARDPVRPYACCS